MQKAPVSPADSLSERGRALLSQPPMAAYIGAHFERVGDLWAPDNPGGYIPLCIAENGLMWDVLGPRLAAAEVPARALGYDVMTGSALFREQLASFLGKHLLERAVRPEEVAVLAGAGTVLEMLFHGIADAGDAVLVPTPSYAGFWSDLETRDGLHVVPVHTEAQSDFALTVQALDAALAGSPHPVRALLFTSPDNPMGRLYTREEIATVREWATGRGLHVVFDEIYGLSVYGDRPFVSVARLGALGEKTHIVWAFSKDFGASGLRCGVLISENRDVIASVDALAYWGAVSGDTQSRLGQVVADDPWVSGYLAENRRRLADAYAAVASALEEEGIPHLVPTAGFFALCDLRAFLSEPTFAAEEALWEELLETQRVNLTPGGACRIAEPGFFRLCFASQPTQAIVAGIARVGALLRGRERPPG